MPCGQRRILLLSMEHRSASVPVACVLLCRLLRRAAHRTWTRRPRAANAGVFVMRIWMSGLSMVALVLVGFQAGCGGDCPEGEELDLESGECIGLGDEYDDMDGFAATG